MCGIAGFNFSDKNIINKMCKVLEHRGPDAQKIYTDNFVSLGHRRLSIIDLSENATQPMYYSNYVIIFNGEIYNFEQIKNRLIAKGHQFITKSDTEVILHAYQEWGEECVNSFNGMWAFCIYDIKKQILFLSRDRFGIKPLYYFFDGNTFIFASEIKAIKQHKLSLSINNTALNHFFYQKYIGANHSIYQEIKKINPSENIIFDIKKKCIIKKKYYDIETEISKQKNIIISSRLNRIESIINSSVTGRLVSDVPVGSFLSGGVDSSLISAIIAKNKENLSTFSIGFNEKTFDEIPFSNEVSKHIKSNHFYKYLSINQDLINYVFSNIDEPFGDPSVIPTYLLSKITREKVTVSLSGDAGDEVFGGYDTYKAYQISKLIPEFTIKAGKYLTSFFKASDKNLSLSYKMQKYFNDYDKNANRRHLNWMSQTNNYLRKHILQDNFIDNHNIISVSKKHTLLSVQLNDIENYLPNDILYKVDTASMLNSLEVRVPFLDYSLVPLVLSLPDKYKINYLRTKYLLKKISKSYIPSKIINRKKLGFSVPISHWIKKDSLIREFILSPVYYNHNLINYKFIKYLVKEHDRGIADNSRVLWLCFVFNFWYYTH